jgi:putative phosphoribosyl transferase
MLSSFGNTDTMVLAVPAGGAPVAAVISRQLHLSLDVAVVSKVTLPWDTEAGYGAVAFDGTVRLNQGLLSRVNLTEEQIQQGIQTTARKVFRRVQQFRGQRPFPDLSDHSAILVDDGLASGFTMRAAIEALRKTGTKSLFVAVPTGHLESAYRVANEVEALYCPNIRGGWQFAVADAYRHWSDVQEDEAVQVLSSCPEYLRMVPSHDSGC